MILLYTFLAVNLIAFVLIGYDKKLAQNNKRRISEKALLLWEEQWDHRLRCQFFDTKQ